MRKTRSKKPKSAANGAVPLVMLADEASLTTLRKQTGLLSRAWGWLQSRQSTRSDSRRLRVAETVSLGEKRFVAVVQVAGRDFLLAGGPSNIALLAQLHPNEPFENVLQRTMTVEGQKPPKRKRAVKRKQTKSKVAAKPVSPPPDRNPVATNPAQVAQSVIPASPAPSVHKLIRAARKQTPKAKPGATPVSQESNGRAEPESAPVMPPFNLPESFRYVLENTIATDGNAQGKPPSQQNGRPETEHTGHWA